LRTLRLGASGRLVWPGVSRYFDYTIATRLQAGQGWHNRCIRALGFLADCARWISVAKSVKLRKSATERRDPKKHLSFSVGISDQKHANRIPRPKVGVSLVVQANVKVTAKRLDYFVEITNRE